MWQSHVDTPERSWMLRCRDDFGLLPRELAALVAVNAYHKATGRAMPLEELQRAAGEQEGFYEIDVLRAPSVLFQAGLVERIGPPQRRCYGPTLRGLQRAKQ